MSELQEKLDAAIWSAHTLFQKGLVGGSTGNISFLHSSWALMDFISEKVLIPVFLN